jgi:hypothetical protein
MEQSIKNKVMDYLSDNPSPFTILILNVESEIYHIAVFHYVFLTFDS